MWIPEPLEEGAVLLRDFATSEASLLIDEVTRITQQAAFRHLVTPGGYTMSVAMTNCGTLLDWRLDRLICVLSRAITTKSHVPLPVT